MKRTAIPLGVTLVEMVIATAVAVAAITLMWRGVSFLQNTLALEMKLGRMSQVLRLTQEISQNIRSARRVLSVGPDHLDIEVYNHAAFALRDPQLYEQTKRVRYQFQSESESTSMLREIYASTDAVKPDSTNVFLNNADLVTPTDAQPYFFASYLVGSSTVGVRVAFVLHPPFSKETWTPIKNEVYVEAE